MDTEAMAAALEASLTRAGFAGPGATPTGGDTWAVDFHIAPRAGHEEYNEVRSTIVIQPGEPPAVVLRLPQVPSSYWDEAEAMAGRAARAAPGGWRARVHTAEDTRKDVARVHLVWDDSRPDISPGEIISTISTAIEAYFDSRPGPSVSL